ncbi:MAG TPA: serine hydrolase [Puia sp.]|nr:serine hydrolase [Puia sp.]
MYTNRREFIKMTGGGILGWGLVPALPGLSGLGFMGDASSFPRATPASQGVTSQSIRDFVAAANASGISWHSFMLLRHGHVVAEGWWKPYEPAFVHSLYSLSKSFTSTAIGLLVKEGKLDIHAKVISFFPHDLPDAPGEHLQQMTVRSLLTMNTGHAQDTLPAMRAGKESWVQTYLAQPVEFAPGTHFMYNTGNTYMLGAIVHQITGQTLEQYLAPRLFQSLGITGYDWETSPQGLNTAGYGLRVRTEDIAKLGQLYLQKGQWKGTSILTESWVEEATSHQTESQVNNGDWSQGYGYQFWRCTHGFYRGDGAFGQFCIVMPQYDAVLAVTGQSPDMQKSMNIIWDHLPGGMMDHALQEDASSLMELKKELAALELPAAKGIKRSGGAPASGKKWMMDDNALGIGTMRFDISDKGCRLSVGKGGKTAVLNFGWEHWVLNNHREPYVFGVKELFPMPSKTAGTATWVDDHTLQLNVRMVEAIFGDRITCVFENDRLTVGFLNSAAETALKKTEDPRKGLEGKMG